MVSYHLHVELARRPLAAAGGSGALRLPEGVTRR